MHVMSFYRNSYVELWLYLLYARWTLNILLGLCQNPTTEIAMEFEIIHAVTRSFWMHVMSYSKAKIFFSVLAIGLR